MRHPRFRFVCRTSEGGSEGGREEGRREGVLRAACVDLSAESTSVANGARGGSATLRRVHLLLIHSLGGGGGGGGGVVFFFFQ